MSDTTSTDRLDAAGTVGTAYPDSPAVGRWGPNLDPKITGGAPRKTWGLGDASLGLGVGLFASTVVGLVFAIPKLAPYIQPSADGSNNLTKMQASLTDLTKDGPFLIAGLVALWVGLLGGPLWASFRKGERSLAKDFGFRFKRSDLIWGPVLGVSLLGLQEILNLVCGLLGIKVVDNSSEITDVHGVGWLIALCILASVGAPVLEELFFRGLLLKALMRRFAKADRTVRGRRWGAATSIVISSLVFGALHVTGSGAAVLLLQTGILGAALALITLKTGRLGPGIGAHVTNNSIALITVLITR